MMINPQFSIIGLRFAGSAMLLLVAAGCSTPVVKPAAFDREVLNHTILPAEYLHPAPRSEHILLPALAWLGDIDTANNLYFAGFRIDSQHRRFCAIVNCDPRRDQLVLLPLGEAETPLDVMTNPGRADTVARAVAACSDPAGPPCGEPVLKLTLSDVIHDQRLGPPIPTPGRIYAVAANFPSHLQHDLAIKLTPHRIARLRQARARVFLKFPPTTAAGSYLQQRSRLLGPYDEFTFSDRLTVPRGAKGSTTLKTETRLDYEVEVAVVIGRTLTAESIRELSDQQIMQAIAGYTLISDTKARNPQVVDKVADADLPLPPPSDPYDTGEATLDRALGFWDQTTCAWWSYAASTVNCTSLGPVLMSTPASKPTPELAMVSARSYAPRDMRGAGLPQGRAAETLYLRQCAMLSESPTYSDALIWSIPSVVRSILATENNALHFVEAPARLERGDVICLGTPGGAVITSKRQGLFNLLDALLFWWRPIDWHDAFFKRDTELYLRNGDEVFLWAQALGYQLHTIKRYTADQDTSAPATSKDFD